MIHLENVDVTFGKDQTFKHALKSINLQINNGDFITVIGSNGAGKSSLLNALSGEVSVRSGKITIDKKNITSKKSFQRASDIARVFQDPLQGTLSELTIAENMALAAKRGQRRFVCKAFGTSQRQVFSEALKQLNLGLENRLDTPMKMLSGGQRQAVSLIMASLSPMKLLLLDEHTAALDPKISQFVMQVTKDIISKNGLTALMVTHSMRQALEYGNRTLVMHNGYIIDDLDSEARKSLTIQDLIKKFNTLDSDRMLSD